MKNIISYSLLVVLLLVGCKTEKKEKIDRGYIVKVGDQAPNFSIKYLDGTTQDLTAHKGKIIMLQFTASWCGVCRKEMPHIESQIWQKHKDNPNFLLLGIDFKETEDKILELKEKTKITYPLVSDIDGSIFYSYAEKDAGITRNVLIDETGTIIYMTRLFDEEEFKELVDVINKKLSKNE